MDAKLHFARGPWAGWVLRTLAWFGLGYLVGGTSAARTTADAGREAEREALEELARLREAQCREAQRLGALVHDLRGVLGTMQAALEVIRTVPDASVRSDACDVLTRQIMRGTGLLAGFGSPASEIDAEPAQPGRAEPATRRFEAAGS